MEARGRPALSDEEGFGRDEEPGEEEADWMSSTAGSSRLYKTGISEEGSGAGDRRRRPVLREGASSDGEHESTARATPTTMGGHVLETSRVACNNTSPLEC